MENQRVQQELGKVQARLIRLQGIKENETLEANIERIKAEAKTGIAEARSAMAAAKVDEGTATSKIDIIKQQAIGSVLNNALTQATIGKTDTETTRLKEDTKRISAEILQKWRGLEQGQEQININKWSAEMKAAYPTLWEVLGRYNDQGWAAIDDILRNNPNGTRANNIDKKIK